MLKYFVTKKPRPSAAGYEFQMMYTFGERKMESERLRHKFPEHIPLIIEPSDTHRTSKLEKPRQLFKECVEISQIIISIRRQIKLNEKEALFLFVANRVVPALNKTIGELYNEHADKDGFLYITYSVEHTYG